MIFTIFSKCVVWDDPEAAVECPVQGEPIHSLKAKTRHSLKQAELFV
jgi:hypothetical protein